ncbi:MAG: adenosine kinase [Porticoccus sp.]|nr:adenosine kinase [Porticoccus sp.]
MAKYHVYGIGAALVDTEIEVTDSDLQQLQVEKGLMTLVDETRQTELIHHLQDHLTASKRASGGSAANTIIAVSAFGGNAFYSCKVANDDNGQFYLNDLANAGVEYHHNGEQVNGLTGKCLVLITPDAERSMNTFLGVSETVSIENLNAEAISQSEYLYMEGYLVTSDTGRAAAIRAREIAEEHQVKTVLSLSDPGMVTFFKDGLKDMLGQKVDLLFCNEAEALGWTNASTLNEATELLKQSASTFAITLGSKGALVFDGKKLHNIDPHPITAIDTNGAGDMFAGAFLYAITHDYDYQQAGNFASVAAANVVSQFGPRLRDEQYPEVLSSL